MNGITTIAAIPSGAGQAAHLGPEIGTTSVRTMRTEGASCLRPGESFEFGGVNYRVVSVSVFDRGDLVTFEPDDRFPAIDATLLDASK